MDGIQEAVPKKPAAEVPSNPTCRPSREQRFKAMLNAKHTEKGQSESHQVITKIQRVPPKLRDIVGFEDYFKPKKVSIGPYYYRLRDNLELIAADNLKLTVARRFITENVKESPKEIGKDIEKEIEKKIKTSYEHLFSKIKELRNCYEVWMRRGDKYSLFQRLSLPKDNEELAWILFVDGCFLLQYMHCYVNHQLTSLNIKDHHVALLHQDVFLLENQLPFQVLSLLVSETPAPSKWMATIHNFIGMNYVTPRSLMSPPKTTAGKAQLPSHLLELLHANLAHDPKRQLKSTPQCASSRASSQFFNVRELLAVGVRLRPIHTNNVRGVSFTSHFIGAHLELPKIIIDDSTLSNFLNLMAYEMCPKVKTDMEITSYMRFLGSLITHPADVKELRAARILCHFLRSDEEVAEFFRKITTHVQQPEVDIYRDVKMKLECYMTNPRKARIGSWFAEVIREHCKSPWAVIGLLAGFIVICLTFTQTLVAIFPVSGKGR